MLNIKDINFRLCKYKFDRIILTVPGVPKYTVKTLGIPDFVIERDYDSYQFPYFRITVSVPNQIYRAMKKNNTDIKAYVRLTYAYFRNRDVTGTPEKQIQEKTYISDNFIVMMEDSSPHFTADTEEQIEKNTSEDKIKDDLHNSTVVEILLYKEEDLNIVKQIIPVVYTNNTLIDILTDFLKKAGCKKVLCSPPDCDTKVYDQFICPMIRVDEEILRICCDYGMHKYGTTLFFDYDRMYILNKINKCTAWEPNEYKTIYIISLNLSNQVNTIIGGCSYEEKDHCGYATMVDCHMEMKSMERDQVVGTSFQSIDKRTGEFSDIDTNVPTIKGGGAISHIFGNYMGNSATSSALKQRVEEESAIFNVVLDAIDLTMLQPNKHFQLIFLSPGSSKYNGSYRLKRYIVSFKATDESWYTPIVMAEFVGKIKG